MTKAECPSILPIKDLLLRPQRICINFNCWIINNIENSPTLYNTLLHKHKQPTWAYFLYFLCTANKNYLHENNNLILLIKIIIMIMIVHFFKFNYFNVLIYLEKSILYHNSLILKSTENNQFKYINWVLSFHYFYEWKYLALINNLLI